MSKIQSLRVRTGSMIIEGTEVYKMDCDVVGTPKGLQIIAMPFKLMRAILPPKHQSTLDTPTIKFSAVIAHTRVTLPPENESFKMPCSPVEFDAAEATLGLGATTPGLQILCEVVAARSYGVATIRLLKNGCKLDVRVGRVLDFDRSLIPDGLLAEYERAVDHADKTTSHDLADAERFLGEIKKHDQTARLLDVSKVDFTGLCFTHIEEKKVGCYDKEGS